MEFTKLAEGLDLLSTLKEIGIYNGFAYQTNNELLEICCLKKII